MDDASLLLATVATAAAALVAIVGGLLVSRVVSLATERSGLLHRHGDLVAQMRRAEVRRDQLERQLLRWDAIDVLAGHYTNLAAKDPDPDLESMIEEAGVSRTVEEVQPFLDELVHDLQDARRVLEPLFEQGGREFTFDEAVEEGLPVSTGKRDEWEAAFERLREENPPEPYRLGHLRLEVDPPWVPTPMDQAAASAHQQLRRDVAQALHAVAGLEAQVEQARMALSRVDYPRGVAGGVWVLGYFAVAGSLVPLGLLVATDGDLPPWAQWAVVGLFASGVAAVVAYVVWQAQHLTDPEELADAA